MYCIDDGIEDNLLFDIVNTFNFKNSLMNDGMYKIWLLSNFNTSKFLNILKFFDIFDNLFSLKSIWIKFGKL